MTRVTSFALFVLVLNFTGCEDKNEFDLGRFNKNPANQNAGNEQDWGNDQEVDAPAENEEPGNKRQPRDAFGQPENRRGRWATDRNDTEFDDATAGQRDEDWGREREFPSDDMPSQREGWSKSRDMPSDSMPSRTEKWGRDRELPSDSPNWGKDRKMPSDTAFRRPTDDDEESKPNESRESDASEEE